MKRSRGRTSRELSAGLARGTGPSGRVLGHEDESTPLHEERLEAVWRHMVGCGAATILDLGCGSGALMRRLLEDSRFTHVLGVDTSAEALLLAERRLERLEPPARQRWALQHGSLMEPHPSWRNHDAVAAVETIEHVAPEHLSRLERSIFVLVRPTTVVLTTPNSEYNSLYGLADGELRHPDHQFEWNRARFRGWAAGVAERNGYSADVENVGRPDPFLGSPTQLARFRLRSP